MSLLSACWLVTEYNLSCETIPVDKEKQSYMTSGLFIFFTVTIYDDTSGIIVSGSGIYCFIEVQNVGPRTNSGFPHFSKYQIPGFLKVFGPKFKVFCAKFQVLSYKY